MAVHDHDSISRRGEVQKSVAVAFLVLAWFFIALRVWTRTFVIKNFGWDDSTMILAGVGTRSMTMTGQHLSADMMHQALFTIYCAAMIYIEAHGGGSHIANVTDLSNLTKVLHDQMDSFVD